MTILGNPDITAEGKIEIGDLHSEMNGEYIVKNATHSLSSGGYQTTMELYKEPTGWWLIGNDSLPEWPIDC